MKRIFAIMLTLSFLMVGCNFNSDSSSAGSNTTVNDGAPTIGLVLPTQTADFFVTMRDSAEATAKEMGINIIILDSQDDAIKESSNVEDLIIKKVDAILIIPTDSDAVVSAVESANSANIPVITLDRVSNGGEVISHIASDNIAGGRLAGEFIVSALNGSGNVVELEGVPGTSAARDRGEGFNAVISDNPNIKVVSRQAANFNKADGLNVTENILQSQSDISAIFAHNDEMALGAIEAIEASGRDIMVVGFDASEEAITAIGAGRMQATIAQNPSLMITTAIESALNYLNGVHPHKEIGIDLNLVTE